MMAVRLSKSLFIIIVIVSIYRKILLWFAQKHQYKRQSADRSTYPFDGRKRWRAVNCTLSLSPSFVHAIARILPPSFILALAPSTVYIIRNWDSCFFFFFSLCWFCLIDFDLLRSNFAFHSNAWIHFQSTDQKLINWLLFLQYCCMNPFSTAKIWYRN